MVGLSASEIGVRALNTEFMRESAADIEAVLPTVFNLILPQLTNSLGAIALPEIAGFQLRDLQIQKVTTSQDDFLALFASLGASKTTSTVRLNTSALQPTASASVGTGFALGGKATSASSSGLKADMGASARIRFD